MATASRELTSVDEVIQVLESVGQARFRPTRRWQLPWGVEERTRQSWTPPFKLNPEFGGLPPTPGSSSRMMHASPPSSSLPPQLPHFMPPPSSLPSSSFQRREDYEAAMGLQALSASGSSSSGSAGGGGGRPTSYHGGSSLSGPRSAPLLSQPSWPPPRPFHSTSNPFGHTPSSSAPDTTYPYDTSLGSGGAAYNNTNEDVDMAERRLSSMSFDEPPSQQGVMAISHLVHRSPSRAGNGNGGSSSSSSFNSNRRFSMGGFSFDPNAGR